MLKLKTQEQPYIIAEIGCNHCGSLEMSVDMVKVAADCGVDAVKFQKRTPSKLFSESLLNSPYDSPHSYGATYGEHRNTLDVFSNVFETACWANNVDYIVTPFSEYDAEYILKTGVDAVKVASCHVRHKPMLQKIAASGKQVILSTGGATIEEIKNALLWLGDCDVTLLHCISSYPVLDADLDLNNIVTLKKLFPDNVVGFSSHHSGLLPHFLAYTLGARVFEVHFTLNRGQKGTDHGFSLEPDGLRRLCADLRRIPTMLGSFDRKENKTGFVHKFGVSWHSATDIFPNQMLTDSNIELLAPADGVQPADVEVILGKTCKVFIQKHTPIKVEMLY